MAKICEHRIDLVKSKSAGRKERIYGLKYNHVFSWLFFNFWRWDIFMRSMKASDFHFQTPLAPAVHLSCSCSCLLHNKAHKSHTTRVVFFCVTTSQEWHTACTDFSCHFLVLPCSLSMKAELKDWKMGSLSFTRKCCKKSWKLKRWFCGTTLHAFWSQMIK